jgi:hypothetical protein
MRCLNILVLVLLCQNFALAQSDKETPTQTLRGTVVDKILQTPLPGATIILVGVNPPIGTVADSNGRFRLEKIPVGRQEIKISYLGYKEMSMPNILVNSGKETILTIAMEEEVSPEEVIVTSTKRKAGANNPLIVNSVTNLRTEEINKFAGSRQDPSRMASNYAGVAGGGDQRNDIIVRGNSPIGVLWRLEGVDIPNPNHFTFTGNSGGAFSILNNNMLANSDFLTGAFPAEYGNKTAAVFDVKLRNGNNEKREHTVQAGLNGLEFVTEGPISKKNGSSYLASYRYLSFGILNKLGVSIGANGIPQYQDASFKINLPTRKYGIFTVWALGGKSSIDLKDDEDTTGSGKINPVMISTDNFSSDMYAGGISHTHLINEKTTGKLILSASGNRIKVLSTSFYKDQTSLLDYEHRNNEGQYLLNYTVTHKFNPRHLVKTGIIMRDIFYNINEKYYDYEDSTFRSGLNQKGSATLFQAFAHWNFHINEKLTINSGMYFQLFGLNRTYSIEPRLSANYMLGEKQRLTFAAGLHSQTHSLFIYQYKFYQKSTDSYTQPNKNLGMHRSLHLVAGYNRNITNNLRFKAETYYQYMYNVPVSIASGAGAGVYSILNTGADYGFYTADSTVNKGTGRNYGIEISLERHFNKDYYFLTNISLLNSKYKGGDHIERSAAFDIGHVVNMLAGKEFHLDKENRKVISVDIKITHSGGRRIIGVDKQASLAENKAVYDYAHAYEVKLKDYFRTDLKISYNINREKATHNFFIAADNMFNTKNVLTQDWSTSKKEVVTYYQLGIFPYLGYKVQF